MEKPEKEPWVVYLEGGVIGRESPAGHRVYQLVIRVTGAGVQAVVKARRQEGYFVMFEGAGSLPSLAAKVRKALSDPDKRWRSDRYANT